MSHSQTFKALDFAVITPDCKAGSAYGLLPCLPPLPGNVPHQASHKAQCCTPICSASVLQHTSIYVNEARHNPALPTQVELLKEVFELFDSDGKGYFTKDELYFVMEAMGGSPTPQELDAVRAGEGGRRPGGMGARLHGLT